MDDKNYKSILMKSPFGFAYHKIILDNQGIPVDYEFLEVNPAFERITGLKAKEIIGKTVCEVLPGIREGNFDWVQYYGNIAFNGGDGEFEHYSEHLGSWYKVQAYSERKYYFSTVFTDTTAQKSLSDIAASFNNFSAQTLDIQYLTDKAREISGAAYAVLNKFDEDGRGSSTLAFSGLNVHIEKAISMLGFDPRGKKWDYDPVRQKKIDNQTTTVFQQITDLTGTAIPKRIIALLSKTLNIGQVAVVKTTRNNIMIGDFTLIFKRGTQLKNHETIETYADLTGMLLSRIDEERRVINEQARLKTITDNMTDVVWEFDPQFINTYTSPSVNRILGFSVEEYMPLTLEERLAPESLQIALRLLQEEMEKENDPRVSKSRSRLVELEYYKKDGSIISMESNISFIRDKNGKPAGLRGVSRDITERKQSELLLNEKSEEIAAQNEELNQANQELITAKTKVEESESRFRQVSETAQELIWEVDYNGLYTYVSSVIESLLGYTADEVVGKKYFYDLFIPEKREEYKQAAFEIFAQREAVRNLENTMVHKNGQLVIVKTAGTPFFDDEGYYMGYRGIDEDITERKQAEKALQKSNQRLETLLEISQKVTSTIDQDMIMQMLVNNAIRLIGLDTGAIYLKRDNETVSLSATTPALSNDFPNDLRNAYLKNHPHLNKALQTGKHVLMEDALSANLTSEEKKIVDLRKLRTNLYQPIMIREEPMGAFILSSIETPRNFTSDDLKMLQAFANQAAHIIDNVNNYTRIKQSEIQLRKLSQALEQSPAIIVITNLNGDIEYVNPMFSEVTGYTFEEAIGQNPKILKSGELPAEGYKELWETITAGEIWKGEFHNKKKNGDLFWEAASISSITNSEGKITHFLAVKEDITKNKFIEHELIVAKEKAEESEAKYRMLFNSNMDSISLLGIGTDGKPSGFIEFNNAACDIFGFTREELMLKKLEELEVPVPENVMVQRLETLKTKGSVEFETIIKNKAGNQRYLDVKVILINYQDQPTLMNITRDITVRKQALISLQEKNDKIEEQNKEYLQINEDLYQTNSELIEVKERIEEIKIRLEMAIDAGEHGFWDWNLITNHTFFSPTYYTMLGYEDKELPMTLDTFMQLIHTDDVKVVMPIVQQCIEMGKPYEVEFQLKCKDGSFKWILGKGKAYYNDESDKPYRAVGVHIDINDRKVVGQELIKAKEKAEESDRLKSAFLANMSHEIRTPMNGILGFSELLKEPGLTAETQQKYIRIIKKSGARMLNIINDIVDISKIEAGMMKLKVGESNVNEQIEYIYTFFKHEVEAKEIKLSFKNPLPAKKATIKTDKEKLYAILTNLVKNAIKYTKEGAIEFGYKILETQCIAYLQFYVKDTGIGIPKDRQEAIFERFIQADIEDRMAYQGAGLGLAISKAYVEMLGGKIWVESEEGIGSTFYFTLPYNALSEEKQVVQPQDKEKQINPEISELKILIAEDDEVSKMLITNAVERLSKSVLIARTGNEAVDVSRNNPDIDLILMDIQMPVMNGYEATRQIRQFNKDVVIIAQTAFGLSGDREKAIEAGCNDYISKPISKEKLLSIIQKYFNK